MPGMPYYVHQAETPHTPNQMNFWTADRCKTLSTEILLDNLNDFLKQAQNTKNAATRGRNLEVASMINAEVASRA